MSRTSGWLIFVALALVASVGCPSIAWGQDGGATPEPACTSYGELGSLPLPAGPAVGEYKVLVILARFTFDDPSKTATYRGQPVTTNSLAAAMFDDRYLNNDPPNHPDPLLDWEDPGSWIDVTVNDYFREVSYDNMRIAGNVAGYYTLDANSTGITTTDLITRAVTAAQQDGWDVALTGEPGPQVQGSFSRVAILTTPIDGPCDNKGGCASGDFAVLHRGGFGFSIMTHELAHTFGLPEAHRLDCPDVFPSIPADPSCVFHQYENRFDIMGSPVGHLNVRTKEWLGWLSPSQVLAPTVSGLYELTPQEVPGGSKILRIPRDSDGWSFYDYYFEFRRLVGFDVSLASYCDEPDVLDGLLALMVTLPRTGDGLPETSLLDMTPGQYPAWCEDRLPLGETYEDIGARAIHPFRITPVGITGSGADARLTVNLQFAPEYFDVAADCNENGIPDPCDVSCAAGDGWCTYYAGCGSSVDDNHDGVPDEPQCTLHVPSQYASIQAAVSAAGDGDLVLVADGTYTGQNNRSIQVNKAIRIRSENGAANCTIDLQNAPYYAFYLLWSQLAPKTWPRIEGFTIRNGSGSNGALIVGGGNPVIRECVIVDNSMYWGGGVSVGGGCSPIITNCLIAGNTGIHGGGGINVDGFSSPANAIVRNCTIVGNTAGSYGGGGAIRCSGAASVELHNCVLRDNKVGSNHEEIKLDGTAGAVTLRVAHSDIQGGQVGIVKIPDNVNVIVWEDNIDADPMFVDADGPDNNSATWEDNDLRLVAYSPCIDTGDNSLVPVNVPTDLNGSTRIGNGGSGTATVDMGAYEYFPDCNTNGSPDENDITSGGSRDCNTNGVPDECDIASEGSDDCDSNDVPDECQADCNDNDIADVCDISGGASHDANTNGIPDECDPPMPTSAVSRKTHSGTTPFAADIPAGQVEGRVNGVTKIVWEFREPVFSGSGGAPGVGDFTVSSGAITNVTRPSSDTVEVSLAGVTDAAQLMVTASLRSAFSQAGQVEACWRVLEGDAGTAPPVYDAPGDGDVDWDDYGLIDMSYGGWVGTDNFRLDVNTDGEIYVDDLAIVENKIAGTVAECGCFHDCNTNGVCDEYDIAGGTSQDCDANGVPDECDPVSPLLDAHFESGLPANWSATGLWHVTDQCPRGNAPNPSHWAYFGGDELCNFNQGTVSGVLTAPSFSLPAGAAAALTYFSLYEGEAGDSGSAGYDWAWVTVNGVEVDDVSLAGSRSMWMARQVDLTPFAGQTVTITWHFYSVDEQYNGTLGWQVDAVKVAVCPPPPPVITSVASVATHGTSPGAEVSLDLATSTIEPRKIVSGDGKGNAFLRVTFDKLMAFASVSADPAISGITAAVEGGSVVKVSVPNGVTDEICYRISLAGSASTDGGVADTTANFCICYNEGDVNRLAPVSTFDKQLVTSITNWGKTVPGTAADPAADLDRSGLVDASDKGIVTSEFNWGHSPAACPP